MSLIIEECPVKELFTELFVFFNENKKQEGRQNIKFTMHISNDLTEFIIKTDKIKLKQILVNLISNAFKFTQSGEIKFGCKLDEYNNILFYVSDTGIGIPDDKKAIIFERFTQLENNYNRIYGGTGLGLSIIKGLVNILGGKIWFESELNKGSTFYFTISYMISETFEKEKILEAVPLKCDFLNKSILIVEDDIYNTEYIKELLSGTGLNILETSFGFEAIKLCQTNQLDMVLMDIGLPDINGYELIRQIKKFQPSLKIIAQTAYASSDEKQKALDVGCIDYISKPLKSDLLLTMILKHL
jgi:CheY-like chemotaxis protein